MKGPQMPSAWLVKGRVQETDDYPTMWVAPVIVSANDFDEAIRAYRWWVESSEMVLHEVLSVKLLKAEAVLDSFGKAL